MKLRPHQQHTVDNAPDRWALWFKMRVGKSPTAIRLACTRVQSALVVTPKSLVSQWEREIARWKTSDTKFTVLSKETLRRDAKKLPAYEAVIIDEVHMAFGNHKSQTFKAMLGYLKAHNPKCLWILTGTPFTATSWSVYSYGLLLGKAWKWHDWKREFFYDVRMGPRLIPQPKAGMEERLQTIIRSLGTVIDLKDVADVPDDEEIVELFSLNPEQKRFIKESFDPLPIVRYTYQHELEQGVLKGNKFKESLSFPSSKDKRLLELVTDTDRIVVVCRYLDQLYKYEKLFASLNRPIISIHGQMKEIAGDAAMRAENESNPIVLIQSDTCTGYSLKSFDTMIFASMSYSFVNYDQMRSRIKAMEKKSECCYIHLITEGESMDKAVYDCIQKKQDFSVDLYENTAS